MSQAIDDLKVAWRDFVTAGIPASGENEPDKGQIRAGLDKLDTLLATIGSGLLRYGDVPAMDADTSQDDGALAYVYLNNGSAADPANGFYEWTGSAWIAAPWYLSGTGIEDILTLAALSTGNLLPDVKGLNVDSPTPIAGVTVTTDSDDAKIGFTIASGQTGAGAVLIAYPLHDTRTIASLAGKTIRILATYAASANFLATKGLAAEFVDIGHFAGTAGGSLVYEGQVGNLLTRLVEYTVLGTEDHLGIIALVPPAAPAGAASLTLNSVSYSVVGDNAATLDLAMAQKSAERFGLSLAGEFQNGVGQKGLGPVDSTVVVLRDATKGYANGLRILAGNTGAGNSMSVFTLVAPEDFVLVRGARVRLTVVLKTSTVFDRKLDILASGHVRATGGGPLNEYRALTQHIRPGRLVAVIEGIFDPGTEQITITVNNISTANAAADQDWQFDDVRLEIISTAEGSLTGAQATMALQRNFWARRQERPVGQQVSVALSGGDFTNLYSAFANVVAYQDVLLSGTITATTSTISTRPFFPPFENAIVIGVGATRPRILLQQPVGTSLPDVEGNSASDFHFSGYFTNGNVGGFGMRYAIHTDDGSNGYKNQKMVWEDYVFQHDGNDHIASAWRNTAALGYGLSDGSHKIFNGVNFIAWNYDAAIGHGDPLAKKPGRIEFINAAFCARPKFTDPGASVGGLRHMVTSALVRDRLDITGANLNGALIVGSSPWNETDPLKIPAFKINLSVVGHANAPFSFVLDDDGSRALRITSATKGPGSSVVVNNTAAAVNKLLGPVDKRATRAGATNVAASVTGYYDIATRNVGPNNDQAVTQISARLTVTDPFTVTIDGGSPVTFTFDAGMNSAQWLTAAQTALGSTATIELVNLNNNYRPEFPTEEERVCNLSSVIIPQKAAVRWADAGRPYVQVMTPADDASTFAGFCYADEILPNGWGRVKSSGQINLSMDAIRSDSGTIYSGDTFVVSTTDGKIAVGNGAVIAVAVNSRDIRFEAGTVEAFRLDNLTADQVADGETKVSMTAEERVRLQELSVIFRSIDGVDGIVFTDSASNEVGFIPFDATRSTQFPFLTAAADRATVGPFTAFASAGGAGLSIVDAHRMEVAFIPFDDLELRLPYTSIKKDAFTVGPLTVSLIEGIDGIVFTDKHRFGILPPGASNEGDSLDKAAVLKQSRPANSVVTQGHSKTQQNSWSSPTNPSNPNGGTARKADLGWLAWADYYLRGSINWIWNAGVGGENDAQIIARMANDVVAKDPAWCFMMGGTCNSINVGRTAAEIIATQIGTETQDSSNSILGILQDAGIRTLWLTDPTWHDGHADLTPANIATLNRVNRAMLRAPGYKSGLMAVDAAGLFVDPLSATGSAKQYWLQDDDNIHPSPFGARHAGYLMAQRLLAAGFPLMDILVASAADTYDNSAASRQLLDNPLMIATGDPLPSGGIVSGRLPDDWIIETTGAWADGSITSALVPRLDGYGYDWVVSALNAPADGSRFTLIGQDIRSRVTTGDVLEAAAQVDITGMSMVKGHELVCALSDGSVFPAISTLERDATVNSGAGWGYQFYDQADLVGGVMKTGKASVPSNSMTDSSGSLRFRTTFGGAGGAATVKMSRAQLLKNS